MGNERALLAVVEVMTQRACNGAKRQVIPGNVRFIVPAGFQAFRAGIQLGAQRLGEIKHMHLVDLRQVDHGVEIAQTDTRAGFLKGFAGRALRRAFAQLHEAGG
ncbi:hypothetical protein D3C72_2061790 [compost metagenome]